MAETKTPVNKVILVGDYGAGKSSLFRRFVQDTFVEISDRKSTMGLDHFDKLYNTPGKGDFKIQLWDTGGMERIASVTSSYYKHSNGAILVYSVNNFESFNMLSQHLLDIVAYAETAKIFLCGTKIDLKDEVIVSQQDVDDFCEQCQNLIANTYKVSNKTSEGVEEMFTDIAKILASTSKQTLDPDVFRVRPEEVVEEKKNCSC